MTDTETVTLTALDRCDRCNARARALYDNGLLFCAHHNTEHAPALVAQGAALVVDETTAPF